MWAANGKTYNDGPSAHLALFASDYPGQKQDADGDGNGSDGEIEFVILLVCGLNNDDQLDCKSEKKEEIELQICNVDLEMIISHLLLDLLSSRQTW